MLRADKKNVEGLKDICCSVYLSCLYIASLDSYGSYVKFRSTCHHSAIHVTLYILLSISLSLIRERSCLLSMDVRIACLFPASKDHLFRINCEVIDHGVMAAPKITLHCLLTAFVIRESKTFLLLQRLTYLPGLPPTNKQHEDKTAGQTGKVGICQVFVLLMMGKN